MVLEFAWSSSKVTVLFRARKVLELVQLPFTLMELFSVELTSSIPEVMVRLLFMSSVSSRI